MASPHFLDPFIDFVFPPRCPLCGAAVAAQNGLCTPCWNELVIPASPACAACGRPLREALADGARCPPCMAKPPRHDGIVAATLYTPGARKLVLALKHGGRVALAPFMARMMAARLDGVDSDWLIVPVPLHRWRLWGRGYNQAAEISRGLARNTGARLAVDALARIKRTPMLGGHGKRARERALQGAIAVNPKHKAMLNGAKVLLVDDVLTSGATSNACVSALKRAGAKKVLVVCFARVLDEALDVVKL